VTGAARAGRGHRLVLDDFPDPRLARQLSPNGRAHWGARVAARDRVARHVVAAVLLEVLPRPILPPVVLAPVYVFPDHRRRDADNLSTGVLKAVIDCLVRCGVLVGDHLDVLRLAPVEVLVEKGERRLELRLEPQATRPATAATEGETA
jgi:Holliday junction resolvase RusA-like endonuclease